MINYLQALQSVRQTAEQTPLATESIALADAVGRVCAQNLCAPIAIQPFDNSAMDGFAVRCCDIPNKGATLSCVGTVAAGDPVPTIPLMANTCVAIMTGAPMPPQADAVVPIEQCQRQGDSVHFRATPTQHANIRWLGEDIAKGTPLINTGQRLATQHVMALAALGVASVEVFAKASVAFLATGDELVDDLSQPLQSGQIYNSNGPYSRAALTAMGVHQIASITLRDDPNHFTQTISTLESQGVNVIISSGAVSAGSKDFIRQQLETMNATIVFHKVAIKPGKPILFARLASGVLYFGLPGNPVATAAALRFFVQPCLQAMMNSAPEIPLPAVATNSFRKRQGLRMFLKTRVSLENGQWVVTILEGQDSFMVKPFVHMNSWAIADEHTQEINPGDTLETVPLYPHDGFF